MDQDRANRSQNDSREETMFKQNLMFEIQSVLSCVWALGLSISDHVGHNIYDIGRMM